MSLVEELNTVSEYGYISFDDLDIGKPYKILNFTVFKSDKYKAGAENIRVDLETGYLILPERFNVLMSKLDQMLTEDLHIIFMGRGAEGKRLRIKFKQH